MKNFLLTTALILGVALPASANSINDYRSLSPSMRWSIDNNTRDNHTTRRSGPWSVRINGKTYYFGTGSGRLRALRPEEYELGSGRLRSLRPEEYYWRPSTNVNPSGPGKREGGINHYGNN